MRLCVTCGVRNTSVRFNGTQCLDCWEKSPLVGVSPKLEKRRCWRCLNEFDGKRCYVCYSKEKKPLGRPKKQLLIKGVAVKKRYSVCYLCGKSTEERTFRGVHSSCIRQVREKTCDYCGLKNGRLYKGECSDCMKKRKDEERRIKAEEKLAKKKTLAQKIWSISDEKVCAKCKEKKLISNFYFNKGRNEYYSYCKKCHGGSTKKWHEKNREYALAYLKEYNKTYDRNNPRKKKGDFSPEKGIV